MSLNFFGSSSTTDELSQNEVGTRLFNIREAAIGSESILSILPDDNVVVNNCTNFGKSLLNVSSLNGLVGLINTADTKVEVIDSGTGQIDFTLDAALKLQVKNAYTEVLNELRSASILPTTDLNPDLGSTTRRYNNLYVDKIRGNNSGRVSIGDGAGSVGTSAINIGFNSGGGTPDYSVSIGRGSNNIGNTRSVAIGYATAQNGAAPVDYAVAIGFQAGLGVNGSSINQMKQGATAIGVNAGQMGLGTSCVAIGTNSNFGVSGTAVKDYAISIGESSAKAGGGTSSISIGFKAGETTSNDNTIILNASGSALNSDGNSRFYVNPIRSGGTGNMLLYNNSTKEVSFGGSSTMENLTLSRTGDGTTTSLRIGGNTNAQQNITFTDATSDRWVIYKPANTGNLSFYNSQSSPARDLIVLQSNNIIGLNGDTLPSVNNSYNLGNSSYKWSNVHATTFTGNLSGNATTATNTSGNAGSSTTTVFLDSRYGTLGRPTATIAEWRAKLRQNCFELCEAGAASIHLGVGNLWGVSQTIVPWQDPSGGRMYQWYYRSDGNVLFRKSNQAVPTEAWGDWKDVSPDKCILTDSTDTISGTKTFSSNILFDSDNSRNVGSSTNALNSVFAHTGSFKNITVHSATGGNIGTSSKGFDTLFCSSIGSSAAPASNIHANVWQTTTDSNLRAGNNLFLMGLETLPSPPLYNLNCGASILLDSSSLGVGSKQNYDATNSELVISTTSSNVERVRIGANGLKTAVNILPTTDNERNIGSSSLKFNTTYTNTILNPTSNLLLGATTTNTVVISTTGMSVNSGVAPDEALFVSGNIKVSGNILPNVSGTPKIGTSNSNKFNEGWFNTVYGNGVALTSDIRLKTAIKPITNALETVLKMKPVEYKMKDGIRLHTGFLAHEIKNLYNGEDWSAFAEHKDEFKTQSIQYTEIIALLASAIQELNNKLGSRGTSQGPVQSSGLDGLNESPPTGNLHRCIEISRINELYDRLSQLENKVESNSYSEVKSQSSHSEDFELVHSLMEKFHASEARNNQLELKVNELERKLDSMPKVESKSNEILESDGGINMMELLQQKNFELEQRLIKMEKQNKKLVQAVNKLLRTTTVE